MLQISLDKVLNIGDDSGYYGHNLIYKIEINGDIRYMAIPCKELNELHDISDFDEEGYLTNKSPLFFIITKFIEERPDELAEDPEGALLVLYANMYKQKAGIKNGSVNIGVNLLEKY